MTVGWEGAMPTDETLVVLEEEGWRALADGTGTDFYRRVLTADARMLLPGAGVLGRDAILASIAQVPPWSWFRIDAPQVLPLTPDSAIVTYQATAQRAGQPVYTALMSTVYVNRVDGWKMAFHQQTPTER
jgi:hypothetical protein